MSNKNTVLKAIRKFAMDETVGKRPHLYEVKPGNIRKYPIVVKGIPSQVPVQLYHFTLHPECTRAVYRAHKRALLRDRKQRATPKRRYITGFGSRKRARGQEYGPSTS